MIVHMGLAVSGRHSHVDSCFAPADDLPISVAAGYELGNPAAGDGRRFFGALILFLCFLVPVAARAIFILNPKGMLQKEFRKKYGSLYEALNIKKIWYAMANPFMRFACGFLIGITQQQPQIGVSIVIVMKASHSDYRTCSFVLTLIIHYHSPSIINSFFTWCNWCSSSRGRTWTRPSSSSTSSATFWISSPLR